MIIDEVSWCCNNRNGAPAESARDARSAHARARSGGPLGIVTKNSSPEVLRGFQPDGFDPETGEVLPSEKRSPQQARADRWALKSVANKLLPGHKTSKCMVLRAPLAGHGLADIDLCKGETHGKAFYQGLLACGRVWTCPICAAKISERRRSELQDAIKAARALDMHVYFVTLTVKHGIGDDLNDLITKQAAALKRLSNGKHSVKNQIRTVYAAIGEDTPEIHGFIRAFEVTHGENGFHPHFHLLVFTDKRLCGSILHYVYQRSWKRACLLAGLPEPSDEHGVTVQDGSEAAQYVSKWGLEDEMTKAHAKVTKRKGLTPWGMLRAALDGDDPEYPKDRAAKLFQVYAKAFHGRRQLFWSVGLRKLLQLAQELTDEELVVKPDDERALVLATLTDDQWRGIRRRRQEAAILTLAETAPLALPDLLKSLSVASGVCVAGSPSGRRLIPTEASPEGGGASGLARTTTIRGAGTIRVRYLD